MFGIGRGKRIMTTIYRQELETVHTTPWCKKQIERFQQLELKELYTKLNQAKRNLAKLRRIWGDLHAVDRLTAKYAIGEVMELEYYRVENLEKAILEPRLLIENDNENKMYCGKTDNGRAYSIEVSYCHKPSVLDKEIILYLQSPFPIKRLVQWPKRPEAKILEYIEWLEL